MNVCPKCRSFSDDEMLRFCPHDGTPLIAVQSDGDLWNTGSEAIDEARRIARRQVTRKLLQKTVSILVTTMIMILVIYVIVMNTWIQIGRSDAYFNQAPNISAPIPVPSPENSPALDVRTPAVAATPVKNFRSPTPTPTPTSSDSTRDDRTTPTPTPRPTIATSETKALDDRELRFDRD